VEPVLRGKSKRRQLILLFVGALTIIGLHGIVVMVEGNPWQGLFEVFAMVAFSFIFANLELIRAVNATFRALEALPLFLVLPD